MACLQDIAICPFKVLEGSCPACRGRLVLAATFGGNVIRAHPLYKIDFDATKPFDRAKLCDALKAEFKLLVEEEELPDTIGGLDAFCDKIVREPKIRDLARHEIYRA